ncbi:hypothetical protein QUB10_31270 [Microcoleus sp. B5-D4]|uniref:hypothetical protein n=1 Tax=unclassified Microcoleus TaxID=2642155 RepID=UPI002FD629DB
MREINTFGKFHRIQVFYFWTDESGGLYPGCEGVKTIARECIAKARAIEFLPLNNSSSVTDDQINTRLNRIPQTNSTEPSTSVTTISIGSEYGRLTRL